MLQDSDVVYTMGEIPWCIINLIFVFYFFSNKLLKFVIIEHIYVKLGDDTLGGK